MFSDLYSFESLGIACCCCCNDVRMSEIVYWMVWLRHAGFTILLCWHQMKKCKHWSKPEPTVVVNPARLCSPTSNTKNNNNDSRCCGVRLQPQTWTCCVCVPTYLLTLDWLLHGDSVVLDSFMPVVVVVAGVGLAAVVAPQGAGRERIWLGQRCVTHCP